MNDPQLLIVDPDRLRRKQVVDACIGTRLVSVADVGSLSEAYHSAELHKPNRVAIAAAFTTTDEFQALLELLQYISATTIIYGENASHKTHHFETIAWRSAQHLAAQLVAGFGASPSLQRQDKPVVTAGVIPRAGPDLVLIGASTGGITALETILAQFPANCPPTLIVQHLRQGFGEGLIRRLNELSRPKVVAADNLLPLRSGTIQIAAGNGQHLGVQQRGGLVARLQGTDLVSGHCPSVDVLFEHGAALAAKIKVHAALLTGMGADGAAGMLSLFNAGAYTIAQDRESCVVWGMPRVAVEMGGVHDILPLAQIAPALLQLPSEATFKQGLSRL